MDAPGPEKGAVCTSCDARAVCASCLSCAACVAYKARAAEKSYRGHPPPVDLDELLGRFVALYAGRPRQRSAEWAAARAETVGGSELAALLGRNPYSSSLAVVRQKAGLDPWRGNAACWWGTLFEGVAECVVERLLGTRLVGTDISVPAPVSSGLAGAHANSPDGYGVVDVAVAADGVIEAVVGPGVGLPPGTRRERAVALFEFKCPVSRRPTGEVPPQYLPQVLSGLALSPVASLGIFADMVFRKCSLDDLADDGAYDVAYHARDPPEGLGDAVAHGVIFVYEEGEGGAAESAAAPPRDFGEAPAWEFDGLLRALSEGGCRADPGAVCVGPPSRGPGEFAPPAGRRATGAIPWKLFDARLIAVDRDPDFLATVVGPVRQCLADAARVRRAADPAAELQAVAAERGPARHRAAPRGPPALTTAALFDSFG